MHRVSDLSIRRQASYTAWRRQGTSAESRPDSFAELVATATTFAGTLADDFAQDLTWNLLGRRIVDHAR